MDPISTDKSKASSVLRKLALIVLFAGAVASLLLTLKAGRNNNSVILILLFVGWVLSPFIGLFVANMFSKRWSVTTRVTLYIMMLVISIGAVVGYSGVLSPPGAKPAGVFLIIPLISWLISAMVIPIAASLSRR